ARHSDSRALCRSYRLCRLALCCLLPRFSRTAYTCGCLSQRRLLPSDLRHLTSDLRPVPMPTATATQRVFNFSSGPAVLPLPVLEQAQREFLCLPGYGMSILEMSHRSPGFLDILAAAKRLLKELLAIPDNYQIIF